MLNKPVSKCFLVFQTHWLGTWISFLLFSSVLFCFTYRGESSVLEGSMITFLQVGPEPFFPLWNAFDYEIFSSLKLPGKEISSEVSFESEIKVMPSRYRLAVVKENMKSQQKLWNSLPLVLLLYKTTSFFISNLFLPTGSTNKCEKKNLPVTLGS